MLQKTMYQQLLSQHKVYEKEAISTITYKTKRSISPTRDEFSALHYNGVKTQKSFQTIAFSTKYNQICKQINLQFPTFD